MLYAQQIVLKNVQIQNKKLEIKNIKYNIEKVFSTKRWKAKLFV